MTQEALKLALEALEADELDMVDDGSGNMIFRKEQAITAVKEALAEHAMREVQRLGQEIEQEPVISKWVLREVYFDEDGEPVMHRSPPQPEQAPVACKTLSLEIKLPVGFMNAGVSVNNFFTADTNDSKNWDTIKFPLPKGNWVIKSVKENIVTLVNEAPLPVQPEQEPVGTVKDLFTQAAWERLDLRGSTKVYLATPPQRTEQNFCPRCGKRTKDIHTCTPPRENT